MIRWHNTTRSVRISSLKLGGTFKARLSKPHVQALAASTGEVGRINLPAVCWRLAKAKHYEVAAGEDRIASELVRNGGKWDALIEVRAFDADDEHEIALVRAHENAHRRHDDRDAWLAGLAATVGREEDSPGAGAEPTTAEDGATPEVEGRTGGSIPPAGADLDPPDNVAQGVAPPCMCGHSFEQHGDFGAPNCTECVCEMYEVEAADPVDQQAGAPPSPRNKPLRSNAEKAADYKVAAEVATAVTGKPVSPAAVKQAAYRERLKKGEVKPARQKHDDGGAPLGELALEVQRALIDVDAGLQSAITRLRNVMKAHPELGARFAFHGWLEALKENAKAIKAATPHAPCVFCFGQGEKAACHACHGQRWITKAELETAPAELRKAAGL